LGSPRCSRRCATTTRCIRCFNPANDRLYTSWLVETYGGPPGSSEFSLLAGVSTHFRGHAASSWQPFTQNKLKDTLRMCWSGAATATTSSSTYDEKLRVHDRFYIRSAERDLRHALRQGAKTAHERDQLLFSPTP